MRLFNPFFYEKAHLLIVLVFTIMYYYRISRMYRTENLLYRKGSHYWVMAYVFAFIFVVGLRPLHGAFGDMTTVAKTFDLFYRMPVTIVGDKDPLFYLFQWSCAQVMEVKWFFFICEVLYVVPVVWACIRFLKRNSDIGILFCFAAFSFFSYGTNGIRNGMATSYALLALSFIQGNTLEKIICAALSLVAVNTHHSLMLPVLCMVAVYLFKPKKILFYFWALSIVLSLVAGGAIADFFTGLGFDDRLDEYITADADDEMFNRAGFRWDFLLYSAVPIVLGYILVVRKKIYDPTYLLLLGTYILANSFWVMIIRAEYSNRFAYLSWFIYPLVLCYPLLKLKIWPKTQCRKTAVVMAGHLAFTLFMVFVL